MENQNRKHRVVITISRDIEKIESISIEAEGRIHSDALVGFLAKTFRPVVWAAVRELVKVNGKRVFAAGGGE